MPVNYTHLLNTYRNAFKFGYFNGKQIFETLITVHSCTLNGFVYLQYYCYGYLLYYIVLYYIVLYVLYDIYCISS